MILFVVLAAWSGLVGPFEVRAAAPLAVQRADDCVLAIDGHDVREFADADHALRLNVDDTVQIDALSAVPTSTTRIAVDLPIGPSIPVKTLRHQPSQRFTESLRIADITVVNGDRPYTRTQNAPRHGLLLTSMWYQPTPTPLMSAICSESVNRCDG